MVNSSTTQQAESPVNIKQSRYALELNQLTKNYGSSRGITELDLTVEQGEIFGFLGPNGAGKTTTIRLLLNLIYPTSGKARIFGLDSQSDTVEIRKHIGYLPGEFTLYSNLTGVKTLEYFANLRGGVDWKYVQELAQRLDLDMSKKFKQYSRGNKQKVGVIQALMHKPRLLVLDEPTSGLDPLNQQEFYKLIQETKASGSTIFLSSHIMSEVEKVCDRVAIIREGKLVKIGLISELTDIKAHSLEITFNGQVPLEALNAIPGLSRFEVAPNDHLQTVRCVARAESLDKVLKVLAGYTVLNFVSREPSLEETFLDYYREQK
ncbi:ABC transporter ATP-binding protein [Candidatus Chlorohelix sp.]|uniref:ABC transporter ATP-binding protein n=1 Tax=Candidatus Chlorohelix sp. TaxID=3139201 RepID=UPI0030200871